MDKTIYKFASFDQMKADEVDAALAAFDFFDRDGVFRMGRPPIMVEILPAIKGVEFDRAWERRVETVIDRETGLTASVISRDDLVDAKLAAARPQDLADVDAIRKALESQEPQPFKKRD